MDQLDWNLARAFAATAETGSLSAAARRLGLTQPTLSRQVAALEAQLGVTLFERAGKRLVPTESGLGLMEHARLMDEAAAAMALAASGRSQAVEGLVTISASDAISAHVLPPVLHRIRKEAPLIRTEIVSSNALSDLRRREADIAIRHVRPEQPDLIGRLIYESTAHFYASRSWVAEHGHPRRAQDAAGLPFVGFDRSERFGDHLRGLGFSIDVHSFPVLSENSVVAWEMVRQGLGIGAMMREIGDKTPDVMRILDDIPPIGFPVWLVTHRELRTSRRIRIVFDILAGELGRGV